MRLVVLVTKRTPNCFEMEQVKVHVTLHAMQIVDRQLVFVMRERAHVTKLAFMEIIWVRLAELRLVLLGVVEVLHCVVRARAYISERTVVGL